MVVAHLPRRPHGPGAGDARLAALVAELDAAAELECIRLDHLAGRAPAGMRRSLFDHELDGAVNFAELERTVDRRAASIGDRLGQDRARFAELLQRDLADAVAAQPALAADRVVAGRLADLLDPSRYANPIAGTTELVAEAERIHSAELAHSVQEGMARAVAEARAQGIPAAHLPGLPAAAQAKLDTLARRLAAQPHSDLVTAAKNAADLVAGTGLAADQVLGQVAAAVDGLASSGLDNYARPAAQASHNLGHQEAAAAAPKAATIYASELLDRNTCGPCSLIDGHEYASEEEALADYPGGTYVDCEGGDRCRGTLVYVWNTEAPPTQGTPGDEEPPPEAPPPYPFGTTRPLPPPPSSPFPVAPDLPPLPPPAPPAVEVPDLEPVAPEEAPRPPADQHDLELPPEPVAAQVDQAALDAARRDLPRARQEVRELAKQQRGEVLAQLERADALKLEAPPDLVAFRTPTGAIEYRLPADAGQGWDWFYSLHPDEQKRLRRDGRWITKERGAGGGISPDELAAHWAERFGREVTTEQAAAEWLDFTRQADALSTLGRGRLINLQPYGGLDVNTLVDSPYDLRLLFGDVDEAAAHLAGVGDHLEADAADRMFASQASLEGRRQPYELTVDEFVAEVTELEARQAAIVPLSDDPEFGPVYRPADQAVIDRLDELIPPGVEDRENPLALDELHDIIVSLARKAGRL